MVIPAEITAKHGVKQEDVFRQGPHTPGMDDAVFEFATIAHDYLTTAREILMTSDGYNGRVPRDALPIFLGGVRVDERRCYGYWITEIILRIRFLCQIT
jgi:NADH dehydrogenase [ubiquinone] 1 alpha subcomplex assembly factor 6